MKRGIIALLSVLALAFAFAGCGGSNGSFNEAASDVDNTPVVEDGAVEGSVVDDSVAGYVKGLSINDELGVPPVRPE